MKRILQIFINEGYTENKNSVTCEFNTTINELNGILMLNYKLPCPKHNMNSTRFVWLIFYAAEK
jgi:hypothetical protein